MRGPNTGKPRVPADAYPGETHEAGQPGILHPQSCERKPMSHVTIRVIRNGPCRIDGEIELQNDAGDPIADASRQGNLPVSLRRLGEQALLRRNPQAHRLRGGVMGRDPGARDPPGADREDMLGTGVQAEGRGQCRGDASGRGPHQLPSRRRHGRGRYWHSRRHARTDPRPGARPRRSLQPPERAASDDPRPVESDAGRARRRRGSCRARDGTPGRACPARTTLYARHMPSRAARSPSAPTNR